MIETILIVGCVVLFPLYANLTGNMVMSGIYDARARYIKKINEEFEDKGGN